LDLGERNGERGLDMARNGNGVGKEMKRRESEKGGEGNEI